MNNQQSTIKLADTTATLKLGQRLGQSLSAGAVILLEGDLGAGKTTLIQGLGEGLGITEAIVSPTFTLLNEYTEGRLPLYHFDLYRLSAEEIDTLSPDIYWEGKEVAPGITAIEWAQLLPYKPPSYLQIQLAHCPSGRVANITVVGEVKADLSEMSP